MFTVSVRRRDLAWSLALVVLLSSIWIARSDQAGAGVDPPAAGIAMVYVALGTNFPDALGVGPGAGADSAPIIILPTSPPIPAASSAELVRLDPKTVVIVGGLAVISQAMQDAIAALLPNAHISRIAGADRYTTNAMFSAATFPIEGWASISSAAFSGGDPATDDVVIGGSLSNNVTDGILLASIQLPHGAEILELKVNAHDDSAGTNLVGYLYRVSVTGGQSLIAIVSTGLTTGNQTVVTTAIAAGLGIVDNENYSYFVNVTGAIGSPHIRSVMVRYRLGTSNG